MRKIFISSTVWDLVDIRAELYEFFSKNGYDPVMSDKNTFTDIAVYKSTYEVCHQNLIKSDMFLMILNTRYGGAKNIPDDEISITHQEFRWAKEANIRFLYFVRDDVANDYQIWKNVKRPKPPEDNLLQHLKGKNWRVLEILEEIDTGADGKALWWQPFSSSTDLKRKITQALGINDLSSDYLAHAQSINALPRLSPIFYGGGGGGILIESVGRVINFGSCSAYDISISFDNVTFKPYMKLIGVDNSAEIKIAFERKSVKSQITFRYKNTLNNAFESRFELLLQQNIPKVKEVYFGKPNDAN